MKTREEQSHVNAGCELDGLDWFWILRAERRCESLNIRRESDTFWLRNPYYKPPCNAKHGLKVEAVRIDNELTFLMSVKLCESRYGYPEEVISSRCRLITARNAIWSTNRLIEKTRKNGFGRRVN